MKVAEVKGVILVKFSLEETMAEKLAEYSPSDLRGVARESIEKIVNPDFIKDIMVSLEDRTTLAVAILV